MTAAARGDALSCPSAQPEFEDAQVLGVHRQGPDGPRLAYVAGTMPAAEVAGATGAVPSTLVMRFAGRCMTSGCQHFDGLECRLAGRIVEGLSPVTDALPACAIRRTCRWHAQEGAAACHRCPQVVTHLEAPAPEMRAVADG